MSIAIVGSNGQVGRELVLAAQAAELDFIALSREQLDVTQEKAVQKCLKKIKPSLVINATAYTAVDAAEDDQESAYAVNADAVEHLGKACASMKIPLLHVSTDYVFPGDGSEPYVETDAVQPLGVYGASKLQGEQRLMEVCQKHIILRTSWVFGRYGNNFVKTMLRLGADRNELRVVADQFGCPTAAKDIAQALLAIAKQVLAGDKSWGIYHYVGDRAVSWCDFAKAIFARAKMPVVVNAISTEEFPTRAKRPKYSVLSCDKIKEHFDIDPSDWEMSLVRLIKELEVVK